MSQGTGVYDPRQDIQHDITMGQVYRDSRDESEHRLVHVDDNVALLRYHTDDGLHHLMERRSAFEENVGAGRFSLIEPGTESPPMPDEFTEVRSLVKRLHDHYSRIGTRVGDHKAEAMSEFYEELNEIAVEDVEPMDFESIDGIGSKAAENLRERGFVTEMDVARSDKETIMDVPLMGEANTDNLMEEIE